MNPDLLVVQSYRTIPDEKWVASVISAHYDFSVDGCRLLLAGVNDHFLIESGTRRFAVRVYRSGCSKSLIETELSLLAHLSNEGVSVATAVPTTSGELVTACEAPEGQRYLVIFTWAHGRVQKDEDASSFGKALAQLHATADEFDSNQLRQLDLHGAIHMGGEFLQSLPLPSGEEREQIPFILEKVERNLEIVLSNNPDVGWCHGDSHSGNANIDDEGKVTFYDFDFCCTGPRAFDLATFRWTNEVFYTYSDVVWEQFISGYRSVRTLTDVEISNALLLRPVRHLWWLGFWKENENRFGISMFLRDNQPTSHIQRLMDWTQEA